MNRLVLVVDDEPELEVLFRQQFRRDLRAGRFTRWNLPNPPAERPSARRYYPLLLAASGNS